MIMKNAILLLVLVFAAGVSYAQPDVNINDDDWTSSTTNGECDCASDFNNGSIQNFHDTGGAGGNYGPNENEAITFCPNGTGTKMFVAFANNAGYTFDVHESDTINVYDGPTTASPLLVQLNNTLTPTGIPATPATWSNLSGCLTIEFISDGANEGTGWDANIACSNLPQPYNAHMEAFINGEANGANDASSDLTPADTGYVDVCYGDSVLFVATPEFPYEPGGDSASTNGAGYDQSNNYTAEWEFSDGTTATGDSVWFTPPARVGYFITLKITDNQFGIFSYLSSKVRVSTIPSFATCMPEDDTICENQFTNLIGGITAGDTAGVDAVATTFPIGGVFGAQTYLPDGSGQNYTTDIPITGFTPGGTVNAATDIDKVCVKMEHSYLGDLEMMLTCPNGQNVMMFNSYSGTGLYAGGFGGGGTYLGGAYDNNTGNIGVCEEYCFSMAPGSWPAWVNGYNTVPSTGPSAPGPMVEPGTYEPEESYAPALSGCPINGTWTLTVRDNLGIDDGYICEWGIYFIDSLNPNSEAYSPTIVDEFWHTDPTIVAGGSDTAVVVVPTGLGTWPYTFEVEDSFGCSYDTTVNVEVIPGPSISVVDSIACNGGSVQFTNTYAPEGGTWWGEGFGTMTFYDPAGNPTTTFINPSADVDVNGPYVIYFNDIQCNDTVSVNVWFNDDPTLDIPIDSVEICSDDEFTITTVTTGVNSYLWNNNATTDSITVNQTGIYSVTGTGFCGTVSDQMYVLVEDCDVPNVITPNGDGQNDVFYTNFANHYSDVQLVIYNRWGRVVWKTDSYDNSWNGVRMNGNPVSDGTYYYVMKWDGGTKDEAGTITVFGER